MTVKIVVAPKVIVQPENLNYTPGLNCWGCNYMLCVPA